MLVLRAIAEFSSFRSMPFSDKNIFFKGRFVGFFLFMYGIHIQYYFISRPSDSTMSKDAGIETRAVAPLALTVRRSIPQSIGSVLSFFSSRRNWDSATPRPQASVLFPPLVGGEGHTRCMAREGGRRVPISTRGHTLWYSVYICTLCSNHSAGCHAKVEIVLIVLCSEYHQQKLVKICRTNIFQKS